MWAGEQHPAVSGRCAGPWHHDPQRVSTDSFTEATALGPPDADPGDGRDVRHLRRLPEHALVGGVCVGIADYLSVDPLLVRACFVGVTGASGIGFAIYPLAWALIPPQGNFAARGRRSWRQRVSGWAEAVGIAVLALVVLFVMRRAGVWLGDTVVWPLVLASCGVALIGRQATYSQRAPASMLIPDGVPGRVKVRRIPWPQWPAGVFGALLIAAAGVLFLRNAGTLGASGHALGPIVVILAAIGLVLGPWLVRLVRSLAAERSQRIRSEERADLAAHLHDSVLQTLALIQRRADDPRQVAGLARRQERELRHWLQHRSDQPSGDTLAAELERAAAEVEAVHGVRVETVIVGDCGLDERLQALTAATREALTNAAKFAEEEQIDLYAEVGSEHAQVYVRDRGRGFDPAAVAVDRQGVRHSILERMARHGGRAEIRSAPGHGTEVELVMGRRER